MVRGQEAGGQVEDVDEGMECIEGGCGEHYTAMARRGEQRSRKRVRE